MDNVYKLITGNISKCLQFVIYVIILSKLTDYHEGNINFN